MRSESLQKLIITENNKKKIIKKLKNMQKQQQRDIFNYSNAKAADIHKSFFPFLFFCQTANI